MNRPIHSLLPAAVMALALCMPSAGAQDPKPAKPIQGKALEDTPESRAEATQSIDAALAAAIIGAISRQFGEREVEIKLDRVESEPVNLIDLRVSGDGRLRIGADEDWLPLRFSALYDSIAATAVQPRLVVGDDGDGEDVAVTSELALALERRANDQLQREFVQQPARLQIDRVRQMPAGRRFARLEGVGTVDFADQGTSVANIRALFDQRSREWLQVDYELGASTAMIGEGAPTP